MGTRAKSGGRARVRKGLTPSLVLDAAIAIVDADGADALTMRRLAADLGVAAMAVYNHFADRDAILDAIAERAFAAEPRGARRKSDVAKERGWRARLKRIVMDVYHLATKHPHVYRLAISRPSKPESALVLMSEGLAALRDAGLTDEKAVTAYHTIVMMMQGFPFWAESMERYCAAPVNVEGAMARTGAGREALVADWRLVHGVKADAQFAAALELVLDAIAGQAKRA